MPSNEANIQNFVRPLRQAPQAMKQAQRDGLQAAARVGRQAFLTAQGAPHGLVAGKPLTVTTKVSAESVSIRWGRTAVLVTNDTAAHFIRPRKAGSAKNQLRYQRRTGMAKASIRRLAVLTALGAMSGTAQEGAGGGYTGRHGLRIPGATGTGFRAYAKHPGTHGKHFVERGKQSAMPKVTAAYRQAQHDALLHVFKG